MDPHDDQPDTHAAARERLEAKRRRGMQVSGRSTKTVLPDLIVRRGQAADEQLQAIRRTQPTATKRETGANREP